MPEARAGTMKLGVVLIERVHIIAASAGPPQEFQRDYPSRYQGPSSPFRAVL